MEILQTILSVTTWVLFITANLVPILLIIRRIIQTKRLETSDLALKLFFFLYLLTIISFIALKISGNPAGWRLYLIWGFLGILVLVAFLGIALLQLRWVRGKGAIRIFIRSKE